MGANAQTTVPTFTAGAVLTAAQQNASARTGIPVFASTATRDAAFGGSNKTLAEGQACYIEGSGLQVYNGTAWRPYGYRQTFTPSFTNFTLGNGTVNYATYCQIDDLVIVEMKVTLGTTSVMATGPTFTLPVTSTQQTQFAQMGQGTYHDVGVALWSGLVYSANGSTTASMGITNVSATYPSYADIGATIPFTWGNTDYFEIMISYTV